MYNLRKSGISLFKARYALVGFSGLVRTTRIAVLAALVADVTQSEL